MQRTPPTDPLIQHTPQASSVTETMVHTTQHQSTQHPSIVEKCRSLSSVFESIKDGTPLGCPFCDSMAESKDKADHLIHFLSHHLEQSDARETVCQLLNLSQLPFAITGAPTAEDQILASSSGQSSQAEAGSGQMDPDYITSPLAREVPDGKELKSEFEQITGTNVHDLQVDHSNSTEISPPTAPLPLPSQESQQPRAARPSMAQDPRTTENENIGNKEKMAGSSHSSTSSDEMEHPKSSESIKDDSRTSQLGADVHLPGPVAGREGETTEEETVSKILAPVSKEPCNLNEVASDGETTVTSTTLPQMSHRANNLHDNKDTTMNTQDCETSNDMKTTRRPSVDLTSMDQSPQPTMAQPEPQQQQQQQQQQGSSSEPGEERVIKKFRPSTSVTSVDSTQYKPNLMPLPLVAREASIEGHVVHEKSSQACSSISPDIPSDQASTKNASKAPSTNNSKSDRSETTEKCIKFRILLQNLKKGVFVTCSLCNNSTPTDHRTNHIKHFLYNHLSVTDDKETVFKLLNISQCKTYNVCWERGMARASMKNIADVPPPAAPAPKMVKSVVKSSASRSESSESFTNHLPLRKRLKYISSQYTNPRESTIGEREKFGDERKRKSPSKKSTVQLQPNFDSVHSRLKSSVPSKSHLPRSTGDREKAGSSYSHGKFGPSGSNVASRHREFVNGSNTCPDRESNSAAKPAYDKETIEIGMLLLQLQYGVRDGGSQCSSTQDSSENQSESSSSQVSKVIDDHALGFRKLQASTESVTRFEHSTPLNLKQEKEPIESPESPIGSDRGPLLQCDTSSDSDATPKSPLLFMKRSGSNERSYEKRSSFYSHDSMSGLSEISEGTFTCASPVSPSDVSDIAANELMESPESPDETERGSSIPNNNSSSSSSNKKGNNSNHQRANSAIRRKLHEVDEPMHLDEELESPESPTGSDRGPSLPPSNSVTRAEDEMPSSASANVSREHELPRVPEQSARDESISSTESHSIDSLVHTPSKLTNSYLSSHTNENSIECSPDSSSHPCLPVTNGDLHDASSNENDTESVKEFQEMNGKSLSIENTSSNDQKCGPKTSSPVEQLHEPFHVSLAEEEEIKADDSKSLEKGEASCLKNGHSKEEQIGEKCDEIDFSPSPSPSGSRSCSTHPLFCVTVDTQPQHSSRQVLEEPKATACNMVTVSRESSQTEADSSQAQSELIASIGQTAQIHITNVCDTNSSSHIDKPVLFLGNCQASSSKNESTNVNIDSCATSKLDKVEHSNWFRSVMNDEIQSCSSKASCSSSSSGSSTFFSTVEEEKTVESTKLGKGSDVSETKSNNSLNCDWLVVNGCHGENATCSSDRQVKYSITSPDLLSDDASHSSQNAIDCPEFEGKSVEEMSNGTTPGQVSDCSVLNKENLQDVDSSTRDSSCECSSRKECKQGETEEVLSKENRSNVQDNSSQDKTRKSPPDDLTIHERSRLLKLVLSRLKKGNGLPCPFCNDASTITDRRTAHMVHFLLCHLTKTDVKETVFELLGLSDSKIYNENWKTGMERLGIKSNTPCDAAQLENSTKTYSNASHESVVLGASSIDNTSPAQLSLSRIRHITNG